MIERIFTRAPGGGPMVEHQCVAVVAGAGIQGDRYFGRQEEPGQNITLIEAEVIERFLSDHQRPSDLSVTGRNLVTRGVRLNELLGKELLVGQVRLRGVELCDPCLTLGEALASAALSPAAVVKQFVQRGGLRADVLSSGELSVGSALIADAPAPFPHPFSPSPMKLEFGPAKPDDTAEYIRLRGMTRENAVSEERLRSLGITVQSWAQGIRSSELLGFVCHSDQRLLGYCFGNTGSGEVVVLAVLPDVEGQGLGRRLLSMVVEALRAQGHARLFLGCSSDPAARSFGFYRRLGWRSTGTVDALGDEVLELISP